MAELLLVMLNVVNLYRLQMLYQLKKHQKNLLFSFVSL